MAPRGIASPIRSGTATRQHQSLGREKVFEGGGILAGSVLCNQPVPSWAGVRAALALLD